MKKVLLPAVFFANVLLLNACGNISQAEQSVLSDAPSSHVKILGEIPIASELGGQLSAMIFPKEDEVLVSKVSHPKGEGIGIYLKSSVQNGSYLKADENLILQVDVENVVAQSIANQPVVVGFIEYHTYGKLFRELCTGRFQDKCNLVFNGKFQVVLK